MITSLSLMRRRPDVDIAEFRRHWLDPHGVMTALLPKVRRYVQGHVIEAPATNDLARKLGIDGFAVLTFDTAEDREEAYTSARIRECDKDSEQFVGSVTRVVTEPRVTMTPPENGGAAKVYVLRIGNGGEMADWSDAYEAHIRQLPGVCGYVRQKVLSQAGAPGSKVPEFKVPIAGVAEVWFTEDEILQNNAADLALEGFGPDETAIFVAKDYRLI